MSVRVRGDAATFARTILIGVLANSVLASARLAIPLVALGLGASQFVVGILVALIMAGPVLTTIPFGRWMDRVGALRPMKLAIALAALSGLVSAVAPNLVSLAVTALLAGVGSMFSHVATTKAAASAGDSDTRVRMLGYLAVSYSLVLFLAPLSVGFGYDHGGPRFAFLVISALPLFGFVVLATGGHLFLPAEARPAGSVALAGQARTSLLANARLRLWATIYAAFQAALALYPVVAALHGTRLGMSASAVSGLIAAQAVGIMASRIAVTVLPVPRDRAALVGMALLVSACSYGAVPLFVSWLPLAGAAFCLGCATGLGQPISMSKVYESAPQDRLNEAISLASLSSNVLQFVTPFVSGALADLYGVGTMTSLIALALLAAAILGATRARG